MIHKNFNNGLIRIVKDTTFFNGKPIFKIYELKKDFGGKKYYFSGYVAAKNFKSAYDNYLTLNSD